MYLPAGSKKGENYSYRPSCQHGYYPSHVRAQQTSYKAAPSYAGNELVEYALASSKEESGGDNIEALLEGRKDLLKSKINLLLIQLRQRKQINNDVIYQIEQNSCYVGSLIMQMTDEAGTPTKETTNLQKVKLDLEKQKRMESVNYFKDTTKLNNELKDTLLEYQKEKQKDGLFKEESLGGQ